MSRTVRPEEARLWRHVVATVRPAPGRALLEAALAEDGAPAAGENHDPRSGPMILPAQVLKPKWKQLRVYAVEPTLSPVISGGKHSPHPIQGIGAGFIPANLKTELLDGVITVDAEDAREMARRAAREEGPQRAGSSERDIGGASQPHRRRAHTLALTKAHVGSQTVR